jgi:hypothetical protein
MLEGTDAVKVPPVGHFPVTEVVSMGRRNTGRKSQVQEFQKLRIVRKDKCKGKDVLFRKNRTTTPKVRPLKRIVRSTKRGVASTG